MPVAEHAETTALHIAHKSAERAGRFPCEISDADPGPQRIEGLGWADTVRFIAALDYIANNAADPLWQQIVARKLIELDLAHDVKANTLAPARSSVLIND